jgi:hypothetical protein
MIRFELMPEAFGKNENRNFRRTGFLADCRMQVLIRTFESQTFSTLD